MAVNFSYSLQWIPMIFLLLVN